VSATAHISEAWLEPVLAAMLRQFPFPIRGFHSDHGSDFSNQTVARLLNKLLIEQTKSRPRHSNHNGLVETKNGAVIRKHRGYGYLHAEHPEPMQEFDRAHWNPYLNYHRPCAQAEIQVDEKGRQPRLYRRYPTPLETVLALSPPAQFYTKDSPSPLVSRPRGFRPEPLRRTVRKPLDLHGSHYPT
jgi:transposase InsO family protein